ncbi:MAG: CBS domain-containing protein [Myxococcales bacterium]|nr:CBS domain-containing protein [Myxococcales bacterium]
MARLVEEVMNSEVYCVRPEEDLEVLWTALLGLGITGAPVVDKEMRPVGMVSLRDLMSDERAGLTAREAMTIPAVTIKANATIDDAAKMLCERGLHRLVAVDERGACVGVISALDVIAGLIGYPARHPESFPHYDRETGTVWSDVELLESERVSKCAPETAGVIALLLTRAGAADEIVWVESTNDVHARLLDLLSLPQDDSQLAHLLRSNELRFRCCALPDEEARKRVVAIMHGHTRPQKNPEATINPRARA